MARFTIDIDDTFDKTLQDLKDSTGASTKADVIRRAVATYKVLKSESKKDDRKVSITDNEGTILKDVVLP